LRGACSVEEDGSFYFALSKDYDRDIQMINSSDDAWCASCEKCLEPGLFMMYDMLAVKDEKTGKKLLKSLCRVGDYLTFDIIDIEEASSISERTKKLNK
jgi:hypothetical protein